MPLRQPQPLRVFIHHKNVPVTIRATEQRHRVMREAVVQSDEPFARPRVVEHCERGQSCMFLRGRGRQKLRTDPRVIHIPDHMHGATKRREELSCRNIPITLQPRAFLPARQAFQHLAILRVVELVVIHPRRNKVRFGFIAPF